MSGRYLDKYKDVLLFIVLIPLINTINYHLTYSHIRWDWYTYTTYLIDTAQGYIAWWLIRLIILWLDKVFPYQKGFSKRIFLQILFTNLAAQGFIILATEAINALFSDKPLPLNFYTYNLFIFFIWILVINGIYVAMYFHHEWLATQALRQQDRQLRASGLEVQLGNSTKKLPFEHIALIYVESGCTYACNWEGSRYLVDKSLNTLTEGIPQEIFFRLNRSHVVHRKGIEGFTRGPNGKLLVRFIDGFPANREVIVSRLRAPAFKKWFRAAVQPG